MALHISVVVVLFFIICGLLFPHQVTPSRVNIANNSYRDLVIAISPNVPQDQSTTIIQNIQVGLQF